MNNKVIFTISSKNYFGQGLTLLDSVYALYNNEIDYYYLIVDKNLDGIREYNPSFQLILVEEIGIPDFNDLTFKYDVVEFNTAVKPFFMDYMLKKYQKIIYLDPDIFLYKRIDYIFEILDKYSIVLTPHIVDTDFRVSQIEPSEYSFLQVGVFNLGFIAISNDQEAIKFVKWFETRNRYACFVNRKGLFVDQKWINYVPCLFNNYYVLRDKEYNVAYWNISERAFTEEETKNIVFFHFSTADPKNDQIITKIDSHIYNLKNFPAYTKMVKDYCHMLNHNRFYEYRKMEYSYNRFNNGRPINKYHRIAYENGNDKTSNPFESKPTSLLYIKGSMINNLKKLSKKINIISKIKYRFFTSYINH